MDTKSKAGDALRTFCQEFGVMDYLTFDGSKEQGGKKTEFMKQIRRNDIDYHVIEPAQPKPMQRSHPRVETQVVSYHDTQACYQETMGLRHALGV